MQRHDPVYFINQWVNVTAQITTVHSITNISPSNDIHFVIQLGLQIIKTNNTAYWNQKVFSKHRLFINRRIMIRSSL